MPTTTHAEKLSNAALLSATARLVKQSHEVTGDLLLHLAEVDARRLYLERAYPSMFTFCVGHLGLSEDAAYNLITVARLARRIPAALEALRGGRVHLTGLRLLAPHLTDENAGSVLDEATGKSKRDVEELVARLAPKPPVPDSIRRLPQPSTPPPQAREPQPTTGLFTAAAAACDAPEPTRDGAADDAGTDAARPPPPPASPARRAGVTPLSEETFKVQFTASRALRDKLREAQGLLSHSLPDGDTRPHRARRRPPHRRREEEALRCRVRAPRPEGERGCCEHRGPAWPGDARGRSAPEAVAPRAHGRSPCRLHAR